MPWEVQITREKMGWVGLGNLRSEFKAVDMAIGNQYGYGRLNQGWVANSGLRPFGETRVLILEVSIPSMEDPESRWKVDNAPKASG